MQTLAGGLSEAELWERRAVLVEKCSGFGLVSPGRMFEAACRAGVLFNLDRDARKKPITEASALRLESNVFINFNPTSIYDPTYCLRSTMGAIESGGGLGSFFGND